MDALFKMSVWAFRCLRCGREWQPRKSLAGDEPPRREDLPRICPKCKSPYWNMPKRTPEVVEQELRLRTRDDGLRLRYTGYPAPAGPWTVNLGDSVGAPPLGVGPSATHAVDVALASLEGIEM